MGVQERAVDRGRRLARETLLQVGSEIRTARLERGLSIEGVAEALGISGAQVSRTERGLAPNASLSAMVALASVVGLDLAVRSYPGPSAIRDAAQIALLGEFRGRLHASVRWAVEVPLPITGDQRAWDALIAGTGWRYGVEVESLPRDAQALVRRLHLKERDGEVDGVLLVLPDTRRVRIFQRLAAEELDAAFPVPGQTALRRLAAGLDPGGSAVILIPRARHPSQP